MKIINFLMLSCQIAIAAMVLPLWSVDMPQRLHDSNCAAPIGHPESLVLDGQTYHYRYDRIGRMVSRIGGYTEYRLGYIRQHDKPVSVSEVIRDEAGNEVVRHDSRFIYDEQFRVVAAMNSDGADVRYRYNSNNQMSEILDVFSGVRLGIGYDPQCGKPSTLAMTGRDTVVISYRGDCEIDTVGKNMDAVAAMQTSSLFNRLLDALAPTEMDYFQ